MLRVLPRACRSRSVGRLLGGLVLAVLAWGLGSMPAAAVLSIRITQGAEGATPIAVVPFEWSGRARVAPERVAEIVANDLARSGRFAPLDVRNLPGRPRFGEPVRFEDWRRLGIGSVVVGRVRERPAAEGGGLAVEFRLLDTFRQRQVAGIRYVVRSPELRRTAHRIADVVYEALTGERGAFDTRIAYVTESRDAGGGRYYRLSVADSDGFNATPVIESREPVMSPAWSHDGRRLAYVSFEAGRPRIFVQELASGAREVVAAYPGINGAPVFSPDDTRLALTLSKDGNPEIYILHLRSRVLRRVTNHPAIDTEAEWSPDGGELLFTSDRGGRPQIYRVPVEGGVPRRVTFEGRYNSRARYAPDGRSIALVHQDASGAFRIGVLELESAELRLLSDGRLDESPSFAPNGKMLLYAAVDGGGSSLAAVSVDGRVKQRIGTDEGAVREPAWSPYPPAR